MEENLVIFDSHAHYTDEAFDEDRDALLEAMPAQGVKHIMSCGTNLESSAAELRLARNYPELMICAVGIHPESPFPPEDYLNQLRTLAADKAVHAIGEIGLDFYWDDSTAEQQKRILREQLALAKALSLPVILHCREAIGTMLPILREFAPLSGVMHCYSGSAESAREILDMGLYVGFTGVLTFRNAKRPREAVSAVPLDRLLLETDCPYMAPVPFRGKRCDSTMLPETAAVMAEVKGVTTEEICRITAENAARLFRVTL